MYSIVIFDEENCVEGVPNSWVIKEKDGTYCAWPRGPSFQVRNLVKRKKIPDASWQKIKCRLSGVADTYNIMLDKVTKAQELTEIESETSENESQLKRRRMSSSSSNEEVSSPRVTPPQISKEIQGELNHFSVYFQA